MKTNIFNFSVAHYIILIICIVTAEIVLFNGGREYMTVAAWVSITIAIIGVAGGIWMQIIQFKKDAQRIDSVNDVSNKIKEDTTDIRPRIESIQKQTDYSKDFLLQYSRDFNTTLSGINELVEESRYNKRIRNEISTSIADPVKVSQSIMTLYETNVRLENENNTLKRKITDLEIQLDSQNMQNQRYREEVEDLRSKLKNHIIKDNQEWESDIE